MNNLKYIAYCIALWGIGIFQTYLDDPKLLFEFGSFILAFIVTCFVIWKGIKEHLMRKNNYKLDQQIKKKELEHINYKVAQDMLEVKSQLNKINHGNTNNNGSTR